SFLVTLVAALTLGLLGIAFSSVFSRTLPSTVAAYGVGFILLAGTYVYGLVFPTLVTPTAMLTASAAPAPPTVTYLSPIECLIALILSAFFLSPVRRLPWGRRTPVTAAKVVP